MKLLFLDLVGWDKHGEGGYRGVFAPPALSQELQGAEVPSNYLMENNCPILKLNRL